jgi:tetratricopeptide (TPR) repeat protein
MDSYATAVLELRRLILAWFEATRGSTSPPEWLESHVLALVPAMPVDLAPDLLSLPAYRWLRLASALDFAEDAEGARILLDRIERAARTLVPPFPERELQALVCARRGRLARQRGELDAAADWYQRGLARTDGARHRDAWGACVQGLASVAHARGDRRTAERLSRLVARHHAVVPTYARVAALLTLAVLYRQQARYSAAIRCAWQAHDLVGERDERRAMALVELAYLALTRGETGAAQRGFSVVLSFAQTLRVRRPARSGALAVALASWRATPRDRLAREMVTRCIEALLTEVHNAAQPWESLHANLDALAAWQTLQVPERVAALHGAVVTLLAEYAARGRPLAWAEQRLSTLMAESGDAPVVASAVERTETQAVDAAALARLASLDVLPTEPPVHAVA